MKTILQEISLFAIQSNGSTFSDEQRNSGWLGSFPTREEEIQLAERRLGVELPSDYKNFLFITNGFFTPNDATEPTFEPADRISYLKDIDSFLLEIWNEAPLMHIGEQLNRAIVVGGLNDEQYFLLIPPDSSDGKWQYWKFANWIPGEKRYGSLKDYFTSVLDLMKEVS
ncbi:SMI1/KNR4 family protein [Mucilaginibacter paludis]|uniref:Cell wall assembly/cell proliferation coordinating protein, KNR4-like protein n=1 Tax=Mucilaginibacter paludis DSM 18603 TaxID=714943 RepID=H1YG19_9SPHI|nr:SMI1/KNR4 family protein [Mucilaginibacter paludis]EHQ26307.1 Cell wall assembly/cell proliferation coordinating protein, KNR4-like protein [Mucilaginibacter paludis DSM 18603]